MFEYLKRNVLSTWSSAGLKAFGGPFYVSVEQTLATSSVASTAVYAHGDKAWNATIWNLSDGYFILHWVVQTSLSECLGEELSFHKTKNKNLLSDLVSKITIIIYGSKN